MTKIVQAAKILVIGLAFSALGLALGWAYESLFAP